MFRRFLIDIAADLIRIWDVAEREDVFRFFNPRDVRANRFRTRRQDEHIVRLVIRLARLNVFDRDRFLSTVDFRHFRQIADIELEPLVHSLDRLDEQLLTVLNDVTDIIWKTTVRE